MNWSRGFFWLAIVGSVIYIAIAIWHIGIDNFEGLWREGLWHPHGIYHFRTPTGIVRDIDSSLPEESVHSAAMDLAREAGSPSDVKANTTRILNSIADSQRKERAAAWRRLAKVLVPPLILFIIGFVVRWIGARASPRRRGLTS